MAHPQDWTSLLDSSIEENKDVPSSKYASFSTVEWQVDNGVRLPVPRCRTVEMRRAIKEFGALVVIVDARSHSFKQLTEYAASGKLPPAELCWLFPKNLEQYRFQSKVVIIDANTKDDKLQQYRKKFWHDWPDAPAFLRELYVGPNPRQMKSSADEKFNGPLASLDIPAPNFVVLLLHPQQVDYFKINMGTIATLPPADVKPHNFTNRWLYTLDPTTKSWTVNEVWP